MTLLIVLTVMLSIVFLAVLVVYLVLITRRLTRISGILGKVAFGARAVDTQTAVVGPTVVQINARLEEIVADLG